MANQNASPSNAPSHQPLFPPTGPQNIRPPPPSGPQNIRPPPPSGPQNIRPPPPTGPQHFQPPPPTGPQYFQPPPPTGPQHFQPPPPTGPQFSQPPAPQDGFFPNRDSMYPADPSHPPPLYDQDPFDPFGGPLPPYTESSSVFSPSATDIESGAPQGPPPKYANKSKQAATPPRSDTGLIKSPEHEPHVILAKRFTLLIVIVIIMAAAGVGTAVWASYEAKFGDPPTEFSQASYENTLYGLISLFLVCLLSIIVLRGKVHNMAIGFILMVLYSLTFYFSLKGASRAYNSIKYDDIVTIEKYVFANNDKSGGELPQFFHRLQINFKCCGTNTIDKLMDWPERLQSHDFPRSCCREVTSTCGKLLARTYDYKGEVGEPMRIPSGYFLSLTETEMDDIIKTGNPVKITRAPGKDHGVETVLNVIKDFYFQSLAKGYPPDTPIESMRRAPNDIIEPYDVHKDNLPTAIGCSEDSALEKITTIGWEMQRMLDYETSVIHAQSSPLKYESIAWRIPLCKEMAGTPPFLLASNFKREITNVREDIKHMWYISKGITENFILKDVIWEKYCEDKENLEYVPDLPIVPLIVGKQSKKTSRDPTIGKFFISFVNQLMVACLFLSTATAILLFIVFLIFWKYYSRMKLEDYANMPYPPEFAVLKVRQSDLYLKHDKAEYDKQKSERLKEKEEEKEQEKAEEHSIDYEGIREEFDRMFGSSPDINRDLNAPNNPSNMQYGPGPDPQSEAFLYGPHPGDFE